MDLTKVEFVDDIINAGVGATNENNYADDEDETVGNAEKNVLASVPGALSEEHEPHDGREVKGEARDEEG